MTRIGVATEYKHLRKLVAARRRELGLSQLDVDDMAGLQSGYTGKLECGTRCFGDLSMGAIFGALGLSLEVIRAAGTYDRKGEELSETAAARLKEKRKSLASKGGRARSYGMTAKQRSDSASKAVRKRWRDWRAARLKREQKAKKEMGSTETVEPIERVVI